MIVSDEKQHELWRITAAHPATAPETYVLGSLPAGFVETGPWKTDWASTTLDIVADMGGILLSTSVSYAKAQDGTLYLGDRRASRRKIDTQIYCGGRSFN